ncbi:MULTISPECIES: winged helix-turn-helix domain-containing protein [Streptomyces]|uniref:winged helix-turn-helix domain-containing protein n=1 Tax=Streptomyces TaxID=1883 RepID=UPI00163C611E|nr:MULTISPECIES: winged helix-turn-helix domain-containing protein [Streptomyces]MBC2873850.1 winged helix-turn-helix transcriptional regulator [Streptomyces sp. TYQ1024]UBI39203.1 winged helix-turn-helix domain-containing protein [Streptomyces mobaraensis]UKW31785.1 winged helix-turn-helix domain-containing protein [Streptomyces sp. TYQ1024]
MSNLRTLTAAATPTPSPLRPTTHPTASSLPAQRHRLRAVAPDEAPPVADLLHPGATWLPAPQEALPVLPGRPPMVGYLVLVPADRQPAGGVGAGQVTAGERGDGLPATGRGDSLVSIDPDQRIARVAGRPLDLTYLEFELLAHLVAHPHRVHTRDQLVTTVWGYGHVGDGRTVDVHVARLRRKMGVEHRSSIVTVRRVGYKYAPPAAM